MAILGWNLMALNFGVSMLVVASTDGSLDCSLRL